jgi:hypothetical protein
MPPSAAMIRPAEGPVGAVVPVSIVSVFSIDIDAIAVPVNDTL